MWKEAKQTFPEVRGTFPEILMYILNLAAIDESIANITSWDESGTCFFIHNPTRFEYELLPRFFPGSKYSSFARRLNRWNYVQIRTGPKRGAYTNLMFTRDNPELCSKMSHRARPNKKSILQSMNSDSHTLQGKTPSPIFEESGRSDFFRSSKNLFSQQYSENNISGNQNLNDAMPTMDQRYETIPISNNARNDLNMTIIESATSYCQSPKVSAREFATQGAGAEFNVFDNSMGRSECSSPFFEFKISNDTKTLNATSVQPKVESDRKLPHLHGSICGYIDKE